MFTVTQRGPDRLDVQLSGRLDAGGMKTALKELVETSENIQNGKMLYDIAEFHLPSLNAIAIEFSRLPALFALIKKFDRVAILTDKGWLKKAGELEGGLIPGVEVKAFNRGQRAEAEAWLKG